MKQFNTIKLLAALLLLIGAAGCTKDEFTTRLPLDRLGDDNLWNTESDLQLYNNAIYPLYIRGFGTGFADGNLQPWGVNSAKIVYGDIITDNLVPVSFSPVAANTYTVPTASGSGGWNFANIRRLNIFLDNYNKANVTDEVKKLYLAEVYFFKAMDYFEKVKLFGDVPWINKELNTNSPELLAPRTPRAVVMDSVMTILDKAIEWLPAKGAQQSGRINRNVALHLKAQIGLHEGTFRKYHGLTGGEAFLKAAANACERLMGEGYSLYKYPGVSDPYNQIFAQYSYANNPEIILWYQYSADLQLGAAFSRYFTQNLRHQSGFSRNLVDEYLCIDGKPISTSPLFNLANRGLITKEFENRDPRLSQTIAQYGTYQLASSGIMGSNNAPKPNIPGLSGNKCPTGYRMAKWFINDPADWNRVTNGMQAVPVYRYAETLLIYAEAKAELNECTQQVLDQTINAIRSRVDMPPLTLADIPADPELDAAYATYCDYTPSPLLREIRRERRIEMAAEDVRWDDLMRWKAGKFLNIPVLGMKFVQSEYPTLTPGTNIYLNEDGFIEPYQRTLPGRNRVFDDRQYLFPIPLEDLVLNPNLDQNPGWPSK
ncbi:RagB/SusD family nutrient uptake outer membrane protein [Niabella insulamsoli]|uniref:RagB/SusD family nutrient uptake outer membrane protein n=1 Tax=Niabella insulamsoli TaxID=3144874 RepID=UPI0031FDC14A